MILETLQLPELQNKTFSETGIDSYDYCLDKKHFKNFPHDITYVYNSRGYRDVEWPQDSELSNCVWCVGDSFTAGIGSPFQHSWPQVLQQQIKNRVINISMDGASNQWISRKVLEIMEEVNPKNIVIMWSYTHRRESPNVNQTDLRRRMFAFFTADEAETNTTSDEIEDLINFKRCVGEVTKKNKNNLIHYVIPKAFSKQNKLTYNFNTPNFLGEVQILDYARDYHHFDIKTSTQIVNQIIPLLTT